jgi:membrane protein
MFLPGRDMPWKQFLIAVKDEFLDDNLDDVAGMMTYSGILALFPFLLFALALGSHLVSGEAASALLDQAAPVLPADVLSILRERVGALVGHKATGILTIGAIGALWAGSSGVAALVRALNTAYDAKETRSWIKVRLIAIAATLLGAAFVLIASGLAFVTPLLAERIGPAAVTLVSWLRMPIAGIVVFVGVTAAYRFLPNVKQRLDFIIPGSLVATLLWIAASLAFSAYATHFGGYEVEYGSIGGVIVLLLWMWLSSCAMLLGAEINAVLEHRGGLGEARTEKATFATASGEAKKIDPRTSLTKAERPIEAR